NIGPLIDSSFTSLASIELFWTVFCLNLFARCQNSLPELLFGCKLPPTLIDLLLEDAPKVSQ
ncbi:unnamed protein product, partial [Staurois parvus]